MTPPQPSGAGGEPAAAQPSTQERINLWIVCASQLLILGGMTAVLPLLPLYLRSVGVTEPTALSYWTGALGAAPFLVAVFATPAWGVMADRFGHKLMVVRSLTGIAAAAVGMGLATSPGSLLFWRGVQGGVSGVFPAAVGLLTTTTGEARVGRALALLQSARSAGALAGPLLGGLAADLFGIRPLFFVVGVLGFSLAGLSAWLVHEPSRIAAPAEAAAEIGWRELLRVPGTKSMLALLTLFQLVVVTPWPTLALYVGELGVAPQAVATTTGLIVFAAGLPASLMATTWVRLGQRWGLQSAMVLSMALSGVTNAAVGAASHLAVILALRAVSGVVMAGFVPLAFDWLNRRTPKEARGRMSGLGSTALMLASVIGPILGSWLAVHVSLAATFWVPGVLLVLTALGWFRVAKQL